MFNSIRDVNKQFFQLFAGIDFNTPFVISDGHISFECPVRYFKSSGDFSQEERESYPIITITDFFPEYDSKWHNDSFNYVGYKSVGDNKAVSVYPPLLVDAEYEVIFVSLSTQQRQAARTHFSRVYGKKGVFTFNAVDDVDYSPIGQRLPYMVDYTRVPREDGVFQDNYTFSLNAWIKADSQKEYELLQELNIITDVKPKEND